MTDQVRDIKGADVSFGRYDLTHTSADSYAALNRYADSLDILADVAKFGAENMRICAATIDQSGPAPSDDMIEATRDALAEAQRLYLSPALKDARGACAVLRSEQARTKTSGEACHAA